jgi:hypothetical protein
MPNEVIDQVHRLAHQGHADRGMVITDRHRQPLPDYEDPNVDDRHEYDDDAYDDYEVYDDNAEDANNNDDLIADALNDNVPPPAPLPSIAPIAGVPRMDAPIAGVPMQPIQENNDEDDDGIVDAEDNNEDDDGNMDVDEAGTNPDIEDTPSDESNDESGNDDDDMPPPLPLTGCAKATPDPTPDGHTVGGHNL